MDTYKPKSLGEYIEIVFKHKRLILVPFAAVLLLTAAVYPFLPRAYKAAALVSVQDDKLLDPVLKDRGGSRAGSEQKIEDLTRKVLSFSNLNQLAQKLAQTRELTDKQTFAGLVGSIRKK